MGFYLKCVKHQRMKINQDKLESVVISDQVVISSQKFTVSGVITVEEPGTLVIEDSELDFAKGAAIVCRGKLIFSNSSFSAADPAEPWNGISLSGNGAAGSIFDNCMIKNVENSDSEEEAGGSITINRVETGPVILKDCSFIGNKGNFGGGVCVYGILVLGETKPAPVSAIFENCRFSCCTADYGGAISLVRRAKAEVVNCSFQDCTAKSGGAIYLYDYSELTATRCVYENCRAEVAGGAITSRFSTVISIMSSIKACKGSHGGTQGGAYYLEKSNTKLSEDRFADCQAQAGGALRPVGGILKLDRCEFDNCTAAIAGGAIAFSRDCESEINGCKFSRCSKQSPTGSGNSIAFMNSSGIIQNCVFAECKSPAIAEEISFGHDSEVRIENCKMPSKSI